MKEALEKGYITEKELDENVLRILTAKFRLGLFENPYRDPAQADALVRCESHRALALAAARESIVLLKNNGLLPLEKKKIKKIGVFGQSAELIPIGSNYAGPYGTPWVGEDAPTPLAALRDFAADEIEVIRGGSDEIDTLAPACDVCLYFTAIVEGEGSDRSDLRLPDVTEHKNRSGDGGVIVDEATQQITDAQEASILRLCRANPNTAVILQNGAPVDMTAWIDAVPAVIESWYPGEQGAKALTEILFGITNPSGKLPITIPKSVGQLPLFYGCKPSGRGYGYCDNDGKPLYPFGFGMSYTSFAFADAAVETDGSRATVSFSVTNTGDFDGAEVAQLYLASRCCETARPLKELKAYTRVCLKKGETKRVTLTLNESDFCYYNAKMEFGPHNGRHTLLLGTSSEDICAQFELRMEGGRLTAE